MRIAPHNVLQVLILLPQQHQLLLLEVQLILGLVERSFRQILVSLQSILDSEAVETVQLMLYLLVTLQFSCFVCSSLPTELRGQQLGWTSFGGDQQTVTITENLHLINTVLVLRNLATAAEVWIEEGVHVFRVANYRRLLTVLEETVLMGSLEVL